MTLLALSRRSPHNEFVTANSVIEIGVSGKLADNRLSAVFFRPFNTDGASSMASLGGSTFGCAGSNFPVRQSYLALATPDWRRAASSHVQVGDCHHA